jgi:hypothetical protein
VNRSHTPQREKQEAFLTATCTPVVTTPIEALNAVGAFAGGEP